MNVPEKGTVEININNAYKAILDTNNGEITDVNLGSGLKPGFEKVHLEKECRI